MFRPASLGTSPAVLSALLLLGSLSHAQGGAEVPRFEVWYAVDATFPSPRFDWAEPTRNEDIDRHIAAVREAYAATFERRVRRPFLARLRAVGARVHYASRYAPAAIVSGDDDAIRRVAALPEVLWSGRAIRYEAQQDSSARTIRADAIARLPSNPGPVTGKGVKQCVLEAQSVQSANPYIPTVTYYQQPPIVPYGKHPTAVAGIIASQHTTYRGIAPGVTLLNANAGSFSQANVLAATDWALKQGANTINASFGGNSGGVLQLLDRYYDHVVRNLHVNFIKGAGNTGNSVVTPGLGYNSITVGNSFDAKTPQWWDDTMHRASGWGDPVTGHPKPEIVAPGTNLTGLLHTTPWTGAIGSGGSYAGPQGNAVAALLMERDPRLKLWPEAIKATLLASAWHKIETPLIGPKDGCGQLHAFAADAVVRRGSARLRFGKLTLASFDANGNFDTPLHLDPWSETRVVVSWDADVAATSPYQPHALKMDVDLTVLDPSNTVVATAKHRSAAFEIVRFVPRTGGTYTFRLTKVRFTGTTEPYGLAVSQEYDASVARLTGPVTVSIGKTTTFSLSDPYHGGRAYAVAASFSGGDYATSFPLGRHGVPLVVDGITFLSLSGGAGIFAGYVGSLDGSGVAKPQMHTPLLVPLIGLRVTHVGLIFDPLAPDGIAGVTPALHARFGR